jgi:hypothetical protein
VTGAADHDARLRLHPLEQHPRAAPRFERGRELLDRECARLRARVEKVARGLDQLRVERRVAGRPRHVAVFPDEDFGADRRGAL